MYDELVKRLRECTEEQNGEKTLWHQAANAIEELSKKYLDSEVDNTNLTGWLAEEHAKHLWIPVTERLPEIHTNVLVMDKAHDMAVGSLEKLWDGEVWVCPFADVEDEQCPITHWMPLPEPPKEE